MILDFFTEESSAKITLLSLLPKILPEGIDYNIYSFNGKSDLIRYLPQRLRAYCHDPLTTHKVIIVIDRDANDCHDVKDTLEQFVARAGLISKKVNPTNFQVVTRIVIQELESWFLGDINALHMAYPTIPLSLQTKTKYRDPDAIAKPSNALLNILKNHTSEYPNATRLIKCEVAGRIAEHLNPEINRSTSFQSFCDGVKACCSDTQ